MSLMLIFNRFQTLSRYFQCWKKVFEYCVHGITLHLTVIYIFYQSSRVDLAKLGACHKLDCEKFSKWQEYGRKRKKGDKEKAVPQSFFFSVLTQ